MCAPAGLHEDAYKIKLVGAICNSHLILETPYRYTDLETGSKIYVKEFPICTLYSDRPFLLCLVSYNIFSI